MPGPREDGPGWDQEEEWEPGAELADALQGLPLLPRASPDGELAGLGPCLEQALGELADLERRRGLSEREQMRAGALGMLLKSVERAKR